MQKSVTLSRKNWREVSGVTVKLGHHRSRWCRSKVVSTLSPEVGWGVWIEPLGLICICTVDTMYKIDNRCEPLYSTWNSEWKGNPKGIWVCV